MFQAGAVLLGRGQSHAGTTVWQCCSWQGGIVKAGGKDLAKVSLAENQPASLTPFCPPPGCTGEGNGVGDTAGDAVGGEVIFYGVIGLVMTTASSKGGDAGIVTSF